MYELKPGRGPSLMGVFGAVVAALFGVIWTIFAWQTGAPTVFCLFGVVFILAAIGGGVYNYYNATQPNRLSYLDVTTDQEEPDPLNLRARRASTAPASGPAGTADVRFCPHCGQPVRAGDQFCPHCGRSLQ